MTNSDGQITIDELLRRGVINLDKPAGPSSHETAAWVKRILRVKKAGHSGTLDPKATGVLPILLQDATKAGGALVRLPKEYVCVLHLHKKVPQEDLLNVAKEFTGVLYQRPPLKSAVKRQVRKREVYFIEVLERQGTDVLLKVGCEAGTYIRKLCHDIGEALGVGAHMQELRRTKAGPFDESTLATLHDLTDAYHFWIEDHDEAPLRSIIVPVERALEHLPRIVIRDTAVDAICHGARLAEPGVISLPSIDAKKLVGIYTQRGELVALGISVFKGGVIAEAKRVLMAPGTYPRHWKSRKTNESARVRS
ncbi:MAG TPA: RNA-guided pseudouridylation complex pseudouridine synthase subunit Cbf5 [Candidatus Acidoferrales bacterium]|jgi:H/ACA ribonucleoprotein complex subunit 4|nr:RNA-guided pseudouridylation complex pseudouridine synthase subunit Cbf5 [Candidatus Acidoferrales bacterium]